MKYETIMICRPSNVLKIKKLSYGNLYHEQLFKFKLCSSLQYLIGYNCFVCV